MIIVVRTCRSLLVRTLLGYDHGQPEARIRRRGSGSAARSRPEFRRLRPHTPEVNETDQDGHLTVPVADEKDDTEQAPPRRARRP